MTLQSRKSSENTLLTIPPSAGMEADDVLPWLIDVDVFEQAVSHTNWDTLSNLAAAILDGRKVSSGAQNDEISFKVVLAAGTWTFELFHVKNTIIGIYSVRIDGVEAGTIDGYTGAGSTPNQLDSIAGITVAKTALITLALRMATKNASSSNYYGDIQHIQLRRTA